MPIIESATPNAERKALKARKPLQTITEVAHRLNIQPKVLRFWETKFPQLKPFRTRAGRRRYRPRDITLLEQIIHLRYTEGCTLKQTRERLQENAQKTRRST